MTKRSLLLFVFLLTIQEGFACLCSHLTLADKYIEADFVARIRILKSHPNQGEDELYKSDIEVLELFKGNFTKSLLMEGSSDGKKRSSCDLIFKENSEELVYARKNRKGVYQVYQCSDPVEKKSENLKNFERELAALRMLKEKNIAYTHRSRYKTPTYPLLEKFKGISTDKNFAIFEITFIEREQVDSVRCIRGFGEYFDKQFIQSLKKARWASGYDPDGVGLKGRSYPNNTTFIVLYYYEPEKEYPSIISEYNL
jgi:hypothetical protein